MVSSHAPSKSAVKGTGERVEAPETAGGAPPGLAEIGGGTAPGLAEIGGGTV